MDLTKSSRPATRHPTTQRTPLKAPRLARARDGQHFDMSGIKSLWASVQGDPVFMRRVNGWFTIFWILMIPVSIALGLLSSVAYVSALSLWALVSGHWSAWQAARVEVAQQAEVEKQEQDPVEKRVVTALVQETDIHAVATDISTHCPDSAGPAAQDGRWNDLFERLAQIETAIGIQDPKPRSADRSSEASASRAVG